jgi:hypothetical protein
VRRQQRFKAPPRATGAGVVATEFLAQLLVPVDNPVAALDVRLGQEAFASLAGELKSRAGGR